MNARVFLVVLVSAIFMAVWDADQKAMNVATAKKSQSRHVRELTSVIDQPAFLNNAQSQSCVVSEESALEGDEVSLPVFDRTSVVMSTLKDFQWVVSSSVIFASIDDEIADQAKPAVERSGEQADVADPGEAAAQSSVDAEPSSVDAVHESSDSHAAASDASQTASASTEVLPPATGEVQTAAGDSTIPLPANLADGRWQVISQSGELFRLTIHRTVVNGSSRGIADDSMEENFCITSSPLGVRWCFVRIHADTVVDDRRTTTEYFAPVKP